jgi:hypothetical protein
LLADLDVVKPFDVTQEAAGGGPDGLVRCQQGLLLGKFGDPVDEVDRRFGQFEPLEFRRVP